MARFYFPISIKKIAAGYGRGAWSPADHECGEPVLTPDTGVAEPPQNSQELGGSG